MDRQNSNYSQLTDYQHFKDFPDQIFPIIYQDNLLDSQDKLIKIFLSLTKNYELFIWNFLINKYN